MIQPSFQTQTIVVPALHRQNSRTNPVGSLTTDPIGPPMFMPCESLSVVGVHDATGMQLISDTSVKCVSTHKLNHMEFPILTFLHVVMH